MRSELNYNRPMLGNLNEMRFELDYDLEETGVITVDQYVSYNRIIELVRQDIINKKVDSMT